MLSKVSANAEFDGSFAAAARPSTSKFEKPWYLDRGYFLKGWTDIRIWKAAVGDNVEVRIVSAENVVR